MNVLEDEAGPQLTTDMLFVQMQQLYDRHNIIYNHNQKVSSYRKQIGFDIYVTKIMAVGRWGRSQLCKISLQRAKLVAVRHT